MTRNVAYAIILSVALVVSIVMLCRHHESAQDIDPNTPAGPAGVALNGSTPNIQPMKPESDLVSQVEMLTSKDKYVPPADGRLTDTQIVMYLKVREHERVVAQATRMKALDQANAAKKAGDKSIAGMAEGFKTLGSHGDMLTDIRAAKDLGYNTQEYLWVKSQVIAASFATLTSKMSESTNASFDAAYTQMRNGYSAARDDQTRKMYKEILDNYDKQRAEMKKETPNISSAVAYNQRCLTKYGESLNTVSSEFAKYQDLADAPSTAGYRSVEKQHTEPAHEPVRNRPPLP